MINPDVTQVFNALAEHKAYLDKQKTDIRSLFRDAEDRFTDFSIQVPDLLLDYSKNLVSSETRGLLINLATASRVPEGIQAMFAGETINSSEQQAALHVALREQRPSHVREEVESCLSKMEQLVDAVHTGNWPGYSGKAISDVVNIGIGGSDLGPSMVVTALAQFSVNRVKLHFVSNGDPVHLEGTLRRLNPETTLFIISSKSFSTLETRLNASAAQAWIASKAQSNADVARHFVAVTGNLAAATDFGIDADRVFPLWDWVGGRFSLWSAIGLPIALSVGMESFRELLRGAHEMDQHFLNSELVQNLPVVMALLNVWHAGFCNASSHAVVPYSQELNRLPGFLQQLYMESLGKSVDTAGDLVTNSSAGVLWGSSGTDSQHSYFQYLHQGIDLIPVDFIAIANSSVGNSNEQHAHLLANCFSQSKALMEGKNRAQIEQELRSSGLDDDEIAALAPHKVTIGNKPSNTLLLRELNPSVLGKLIALYEHQVYVQSLLLNINAFDQWGVELGKSLSKEIFNNLATGKSGEALDASTSKLIDLSKEWQE
ncbi:MAG: glucose-6-phosphate isomerase [Gammaproteobacteria bacterium]|jgi:glucose-6-phosphate isomerase|nr:glucose-6-phosphate isomerase [Gammaproteobacteria bacterium]MDP6098012.1 glucose-6-phosphate isomerase [Gammaproteobacteria bacterium]|tara:strand:+ start:556 stop:2187 length:1632 start_codon:yes stop_codon:yes gene_type:complete